ncbi:MAG: 4-hydroxy-tetrahydrodipicolinate reductase [Acidimicrobiia bacterium]|nr:4-hydroxy-tetrahydrodipicolinate reductase [Acidimicrobiia bacterium]
MTTVAVSGAGGRMGSLVAGTVVGATGLDLIGLYDPNHVGETIAGVAVVGSVDELPASDIIVEFTVPDVVMGNLEAWHRQGRHAIVGTSGFDAARLAELDSLWPSGPPNCLVVPNFSIGAVVMMKLAEIAAPHFEAAEVIELHHDKKADAPSGTALATASSIAARNPGRRAVTSAESVPGALGAQVDGVPVHSVRLPGLVAHQEVLFGSLGETLTIRHDTTDRRAFMSGVMAAIAAVASLPNPVTVGLAAVLGLED